MEQPIETSGKTIEEAIDLALRQLGAKRNEVEVEILSRGKPGFLGFGAELARVRLIRSSALSRDEPLQVQPRSRPIAPPNAPGIPVAGAHMEAPAPVTSPEAVTEARTVVAELLTRMRVSANTEMGRSPNESPTTPVIEISGADAGLLIGRSGETLWALQLVVNLVVAQKHPGGGPIIVDVERYRERRADVLRRLAMRIADKVVSSGKPFILEPMPPYERRLIHMALANDSRISTESVGEGEERKVGIRPRQGAALRRDNGGPAGPAREVQENRPRPVGGQSPFRSGPGVRGPMQRRPTLGMQNRPERPLRPDRGEP